MSQRYEVEAVIGRGASGIVYRARQVGAANRVVAYKRIATPDATSAARIRAEIAALATLDHPHVVRIFDVVDDGIDVAIVMQHAAGGSLADRLQCEGSLRPSDVATILIAIAEAVAAAHARGVLHGDIKPSNILFTGDGHPLLSDFGSTMLAAVDGCTTHATPEYLDPAVAAGRRFDEGSDVYALAVVGFEMLTGRRPDLGEKVGVQTQAAAGDPPLRALLEVVGHVLSGKSSRRGAADAFAEALRRVLALPRSTVSPIESGVAEHARMEPPTRSFGPRPPARSAPPEQRPPWRRIAAVAAALIVGPSLVVGLWRSGQTPAPAVASAMTTAQLPAARPPCPGVPAVPSGDSVQQGDLLGQGCVSWVRIRGAVVEAAVPGRSRLVRVRVGRRTDQVLLGDWDCNGSDTVAVYRPATGEVFEFGSWPRSRGGLTSESGVATGFDSGVAVVTSTNGCDRVTVKPPIGA